MAPDIDERPGQVAVSYENNCTVKHFLRINSMRLYFTSSYPFKHRLLPWLLIVTGNNTRICKMIGSHIL